MNERLTMLRAFVLTRSGPLTVLALLASVCSPGCSRCGGDAAGPGTGQAAAAIPEELPPGLAAQGYVGTRVCAGCHEEVARDYAATGHARSAWAQPDIPRAMAGVELPASFEHPASGFGYRVGWEEGKLRVSESYRLPGGEEVATRSAVAALTVGSGRLTFTSLGARELQLPDGPAVELFQLPATRYRAASLWSMSPGYDRPGQQRFDRGISERCMFCHNGPMEPVPGRAYVFRPPLAHGITCERCHGPAREHVSFHQQPSGKETGIRTPNSELPREGIPAAAGGRRPASGGQPVPRAERQPGEPLVSLAALPPARRMEICQTCHLEGDARVLRQGRRSIYEFRPGEPLGDLMWIFVQEEADPQLFTHSSHGERLLRSRCYTESGGDLRCEHCHPAHRPSPRDPGSYNQVCLRCHTLQACTRPQRSAAEHRSEKDPCTDCHMGWGGTSDIPHVTTIDHWIRRPPPDRPPGSEDVPDPTVPGARPHHKGSGRLRPAIGPEARPATLAEEAAARAEAYLEFAHGSATPDLTEYAREAVSRALEAEPGRATTWRLQARVAARSDDRGEECRALQQAAALDRSDTATWEQVGTCRGEAGNVPGARQAFSEALRLDPRSVVALNRLGFLELLAGRPAEAEKLYRQALEVEPELASTHHNLAVLYLKQGDLPRAEQSWRRAVTLDPLLPVPVQGLVEVLVRQGKQAEALPWARQAAKLLPGDEVVLKRLAELEGGR